MMTKIDAALDICIELGKVLSETEEYQNMKKAELALMHDQDARNLVEGLQKLQMDVQKKKLAGLPLTEEDKKQMQEAEAKAIENSIVKASFEAHEKFQAMMTLVSTKIRQGIRANEQPEISEDDVEDINA
ncbi:hypothetical protein Dred_0631 [Desulforamulus reducens MI-1]|uniref:YlbF family regulator n=1 Tax=Desulforamulus reducens (strain ATCC BAA-1160 / DSM 100696 / MI-1) TaxID=349161 RepID=A4J268_DESRM|nr:YlbF family regulator [Desulforamulus reducens]ABO49171.1 hypothetical protein Dred_0631 [Desulforamulus reducens MI-1]